MKNKFLIYFIFFTSFSYLVGCAVTPSSGKRDIVLMSEEEEKSIGAREDPKIVKQFGGIYKNENLQNYVESLGEFLVTTSETPDQKFKFTILDTPIVNAFALPGGYIYLTRGLIYLCQNEAQLAGVIAHEIGHVTGRHTAKRYTKTIGTNLIANLLGIILKNPSLNNLVNTSASLYLLSYSREHEYEADQLATRYMIRAGFDPQEMANFLKVMENFSKVQKKILGDNKKVSELLLTHPTSSKRVSEVIKNSSESVSYKPIIGREVFLKKIDGILFGDKPEDGFFYKNKFIHKKLDFAFDFDESFFFFNNPNYLLGIHDDETKIIFNIDKNENIDDLKYFARWAKISKKNILNYSQKKQNDFEISSSVVKKPNNLLKLVLIKSNDKLYRFMLITDEKKFEYQKIKFEKVVSSFEKVSKSVSLQKIHPPRIRILKNSNKKNFMKDIINSSGLQKKYSDEIFNSINNIINNEQNLEKLKTVY